MQLLNFLQLFTLFIYTIRATSNGLTDVVTWDPYSLLINDERVFIYSGEFHYARLPVPELWLDVFQKFKANGLNSISIYFFWSYHSPSKGVFDFENGAKDVQRVLDYAKEAGLYVIARPGPYTNAETNGGGLALWTSDGSGGKLRTSNETYHQAWLPWQTKISNILAKNQITNGGPVVLLQIENELQETSHKADNTRVLYMEQIENATRDAGIVVPFTSNEKGMRSQSWSVDYENVGGAVDIYGLDSYPGGMSCTNVNSGFSLVRTYYQWFQSYSYSQPEFIPEFEAGWYSAWGGSFYDDCSSELNPEFIDVYYKNNIAQRLTLINLYMAFGGTNWGHLAAPVVYTSYDYSAPLRETREIRSKLSQVKLLGLFLRVSTDLLKTYMVGNGTGYATNTSDIYTWELRNPDTNSAFYTTQHATSSSRVSTTFSVTVNTTAGNITIPNVNLNGRQSKILVTDYTFGNHSLLYCSADILTYGNFDNDVLVLYLDEGQVGDFAFKKTSSNLTWNVYGTSVGLSESYVNATSSTTLIRKFTYTQGDGETVVKFSNGVLLYLLDRATAYTFWAPPTTTDPKVDASEQIFILGPYLVRNASISSGVVSISGDNANTTSIEIYTGNSQASSIEWNGQALSITKTKYGSLIGTVPGASSRNITLPSLANWKVHDSLPELSSTYNDSAWPLVNHTTTLSPISPLSYPVLFASDYGYYNGIKVYRALFNANDNLTSLTLSAQNGKAAGWNAWINGALAASAPGDADTLTQSIIIDLTSTNLTLKEEDNLLTVLCDYTGHDETSTSQGVENPRGLTGAIFSPSTTNFTSIRIRGAAGEGPSPTVVDSIRGPMNEGGLYAERLGWHLPGFPTTSWESGSPLTGLSSSGVNFYVTTFNLSIDSDLDVPIGIQLSAPADSVLRAQLFVNGYQYGKYVPHIGPQSVFPIPPGVLNTRGKNTLALSLWAQTDAGAQLDGVELVEYGRYVSGFGFGEDWSYLRPEYEGGREKFA
ncbi:MAG: hypothetical protein M1834_001590 [Cirrosporium novae-zelandiae]|nr:MAG: hypothetical protein M1834_004107 [Cirrosporium novae-zelandiae]KAI9735574.1 MAG: hypothetical protein M1834_001590 [Cirrosporium novae-zelandiae]